MSFCPSDSQGENAPVECDCGAVHPRGYTLIGCSHPACEETGCHLCLAECDCSSTCGRFCSTHLTEIPVPGHKPLLACIRCESEDLDEAEAA